MISGPLTQAQALDLLRRTSDEGWLTAELSGPDGTAILNARTAIAAATSTALHDQAAATTISDAPGGRPGVCLLSLVRTDATFSIDIPKGYPFRTLEGIDLILSQPINIPVGALTVDLPLETVRSTELVNTYVEAFDETVLAGAVMPTGTAATDVLDSGLNIVLGPSAIAAATSLCYDGSTLITLAASDWLSVHGNERGQRRQAGESVEEYRGRIRLFPDAVSPIALSVAAHAAANNAGLPPVFCLETIDSQASAALLAAYSLAYADSPFFDDYLDDPIGESRPGKLPWRSLEMVSIREGRAYLRLIMDGVINEPDGAVLYLDDGYWDDEVWGYPDAVFAQRCLGALLTVPATIDKLRAAGVTVDFYIDNGVEASEVGTSADVGVVVVWALLADPLGPPWTKAWLIREGLVSHTPTSSAFYHGLVFLFDDGTWFVTPPTNRDDCEHLTLAVLEDMGYPFKPVVAILGLVQSDGATPVTLTGTFWATEYAL